MIRSTFFCLVCILTLPFTILSSPALKVVIPEIKINPYDGSIVGESFTDIPSLPDEINLFRENENLVFTTHPGIPIMFQIVVPGQPVETIRLSGSMNGRMEIYAVGVVQVEDDRFFPDPLIPLPFDSQSREWRIPSAGILLPEEAKFQVFWVEWTPWSSPAGNEPSMVLELSGETFQEKIPIQVKVIEAALPETHFYLDFNEYGDKYLRPFGEKLTLEQLITIEQQIFQIIHAHYGILNPLPYKSQRGNARKWMAPDIVNNDLLNPELDWRIYDQRFGPYFDGSAFEDGQPLHHFYLPFNPNWPAPFQLYFDDRERYEKIWEAFARNFVQHFNEKGWTQTIFQLYCNQKPQSNNNIPWNLDEPKGVKDYRALRYYADLTHRVFADAAPVQVKFRMDISHFYCDKHRGSEEKDFRVNQGHLILEPVDIWVISNHSLSGMMGMMEAEELLRKGKEVWMYGDTPIIPEKGRDALLRIYNAWYHQLNGFLIWKTFAYDTRVSAGKDFILYILPVEGKPTLLPSIRFKLLRKAIDDTRIFAYFIQEGELTREQIASLWEDYYSKSMQMAQNIRLNLWEILSNQ